MKKYILIYKSNNRNLKIEFVNNTLLDFVNDLERFKSKKGENMTMIILDTIVRFIPIVFIAWIVFGKGNKC
jgi:hypothetical protein